MPPVQHQHQNSSQPIFYRSVWSEVRAAFPGQLLAPLAEAAQVMGMSPKTARNLQAKGNLPFALVRVGRLVFVPIVEIVRFLSERLAAAGIKDYFISAEPAPAAAPPAAAPSVAAAVPATPKRPRGRPRKIARVEGGAQ